MSRLKAIAEIIAVVSADVWHEITQSDYAVLATFFAAGAATALLLVWIL